MSRLLKPIVPYPLIDKPYRRPYPPRPKPAYTWGKPVTVCIAIGCDCYLGDEIPPKIVLVMDRLLSWDISSVETAIKGSSLGTRWHAMFAANDASPVPLVIGRAVTIIREANEESDTAVMNAVETAYQEIRRERIEKEILGTYKLSIDEFLKRGKQFPESIRIKLHNAMEGYDLGCTFLVCGFDSDSAKSATIFSVYNPGLAYPRIKPTFSAIGAGYVNALTYLERQQQFDRLSLSVSLYNGIAAKSLAESATGVGKQTLAGIVECGKERMRFLEADEVDSIKKIWLEEEATLRPNNLEKIVQGILGKN